MKSLVNICLNFAAKAPLLAYNSFIEAIYVLNDCTGHGVYRDSASEKFRQKTCAFCNSVKQLKLISLALARKMLRS